MNTLDHFSVPYLGLKDGKHTFKFEVDDDFFDYFDQNIIQKGSFQVILDLDKRPDMGIAEFSFEGEAQLECDRCLSPMMLPLEDEWKLHVKFGEDRLETEELIVLPPETSSINFAQTIYEAIILALPMVRMHEDRDDCDPVMIAKLKPIDDEEDEDDEEDDNDVWQSLKDLNLN